MKSTKCFVALILYVHFLKMTQNSIHTPKDRYYIIEKNDDILYKEACKFYNTTVGIRAMFTKFLILAARDFFDNFFIVYELKLEENDYISNIICIAESCIAIFDKYLHKGNDLSNSFKTILSRNLEKPIVDDIEIHRASEYLFKIKDEIMESLKENDYNKHVQSAYGKQLIRYQEWITLTMNMFFQKQLSDEEKGIFQLKFEKLVFVLDLINKGFCDFKNMKKIYNSIEKISMDDFKEIMNKTTDEYEKLNIAPRFIISLQYDLDYYTYYAKFFVSFFRRYETGNHNKTEFVSFSNILARNNEEMEEKLIAMISKTDAYCKLIHHTELYIYAEQVGLELIQIESEKQTEISFIKKIWNGFQNIMYSRNQISLNILQDIYIAHLEEMYYVNSDVIENLILKLYEAYKKIKDVCKFNDLTIENHFISQIFNLKSRMEIIFTQSRFLETKDQIDLLLNEIDYVCSLKIINDKNFIKGKYSSTSFFLRYYTHETERLDLMVENIN